jgi:hypothetical protein
MVTPVTLEIYSYYDIIEFSGLPLQKTTTATGSRSGTGGCGDGSGSGTSGTGAVINDNTTWCDTNHPFRRAYARVRLNAKHTICSMNTMDPHSLTSEDFKWF